MIKEAINRILELAPTEVLDINGFKYTTKQISMVKYPSPETIKATTLTSLVDYIKSNTDPMINQYGKLIVHVVSPHQVCFYSQIRPDGQRDDFFECNALTPSVRFGQFQNTEDFNIMMQSCFVDNMDKGLILQVVGNIQEDNIGTVGDDGVTQTVVAKVGVSTKANVVIPNPVKLAPYRTFPEIEQVESNFVFRMKTGPQAALFEADGGAWKNETMKRIKEWLECSLHPKQVYEGDCDLAAPIPNENITIIA